MNNVGESIEQKKGEESFAESVTLVRVNDEDGFRCMFVSASIQSFIIYRHQD